MSRSKGIGIGKLTKLILALLFAGFIFTLLTNSPVSKAIMQGFDLTKQQTDYTIDISNKQNISDLAMFVYHRASDNGCDPGADVSVPKQNNGQLSDPKGRSYGGTGGYPGLEGSYLTTTPECYGTESTIASSGATDLVADEGNDMEGIFSREKFEVTQRVNLTSDGSTWLEEGLVVASKRSYNSFTHKNFNCAMGGAFAGTGGTRFPIFFQPTPPDNRAEPWMMDELSGAPYCTTSLEPELDRVFDGSMNSEVILCKGDEGYIQMNKGKQKPWNDGEAGGGLSEQDQFQYPHIVITKLGEDCGDAVTGEPLLYDIDAERVDRVAGGDGLKVTATVKNRRLNQKDLKLRLMDETDQMASESKNLNPDESRDYTLRSKSLPDPFTVDGMDITGSDDTGCWVDLELREDGNLITTDKVMITEYKDSDECNIEDDPDSDPNKAVILEEPGYAPYAETVSDLFADKNRLVVWAENQGDHTLELQAWVYNEVPDEEAASPDLILSENQNNIYWPNVAEGSQIMLEGKKATGNLDCEVNIRLYHQPIRDEEPPRDTYDMNLNDFDEVTACG